MNKRNRFGRAALRRAAIAAAVFTGLALAAPAQLHVRGELGRGVRVSATIGGHAHHAPRYHVPRHHPRRIVRYQGRRHHHHGHRQHGYWRTVRDRVWVPGGYRTHHYPPRYGWVYDGCGNRVWGIVEAGGTRRIQLPGHYETRLRRVWVSY